MKIEGYEEISREEYNELRGYEGLYVDDNDLGKVWWFKKAQKFPIVFEDEDKKITVDERGIFMIDNNDKESVRFDYDGSFPLLVKAVEKAKEVMKK